MAEQDPTSSASGRPTPTAAVMQIIWLALLAAIGMYAVVGIVVMKPGMFANIPPAQLNVFAMVLAAAAVGQIGLALGAPSILPKMPKVSLQILRWAMAESIAISGLLLRILGGSTTWFLMFIGCSALLMMTLRPTQDEQKS